ncbi:MAG TPA: VCBS repeat-containing protein, partial [Gemmataceae bacterium]|nr:VCBS repeat-containing protein [Gemmataceae bacterium]
MTAQRFDAGALTNFSDGTAVGDFNNDGKLDVLAFDSSGLGNAYLTLGNGDGSFQSPTQVSTEPLGDVVVGDFNHDGNLDFACADRDNITNVSIAVYLGNGDGTFQAPKQMVEPFNFGSMVAGDFNGDGKLDLALSAEPLGVTTVYIFQGNGDGTFQNPVLTPLTDVTHGVTLTAADLNHDGKADLVALRAWTPSTTIDILLSNGDGTLRETASMKLGEELAGAAVGDLNGDGIPDLVVADHTDQVSPSGYWRLQGKGDGTFQTPVFTPTTFVTSAAVLRDLNGDGKLDLVMFDLTESSKFTISLGDGHGAFTEGASYTDAPGSYSGALGDFNGDGKVDIVMATWPLQTPTGIFSASLVLGNGDGTFKAERVFSETPTPTFATPFNSTAVGLGDFNGDGNLDAVVAANSYFTPSLVSLQQGKGDGTFAPPYETLALSQPGVALVVADLNHDGHPDFAVLDTFGLSFSDPHGNVSVGINRGDGTFPGLNVVFTDHNTTALAVGDFNGDGIPDLVVGPTSSGVAVLLGKGDGTFQNPVYSAARADVTKIVVADFNGDGKLDLATADGNLLSQSPSDINILLGNGNGTFQAPVTYSFAAAGFVQRPEDIVAGDFNEDGRPDLFITTKDNAGNVVPSTLLINDGNGAFHVVAGPTISGSGAVAADFNNDGHLDIAVASGGIPNGPSQAQLDGVILYGKGDGTFQDASIMAMGSEPSGPAVGDINHSGLPSIVVGQLNGSTSNTPDPSIGVILNTGPHYQLAMPLNAAVGVPVSVVITALDAFGNVVTGYAGTLHFTSSDQNATLPANYTFTPSDKGEHAFTVTLNSFGSQSITAADTAHSGITGTQSG